MPYVEGTTDKVSRLLKKHNIKTTFRAERKINTLLRSSKDIIPLEAQGVYEIPCGGCNQVYIGQTNRRISARVKEHVLAVKRDLSTSSLAQHSRSEGHRIDFDNTKTLATVPHMLPRIIREAIEIQKRPHSMNKRDDALRLPSTWKPILNKHSKKSILPTITSSKQPQLKVTVTSNTTDNNKNPEMQGPMTRSRSKINALLPIV